MSRAVTTAIFVTIPLLTAIFGVPDVLAQNSPEARAALRAALLFHAPFDGGPDAAHAAGDPKLYTAPRWGQWQAAEQGLPDEEHAAIAEGQGRYGDALEFKAKRREILFFRGPENIGYTRENWNGSVSLWMQINPDEDLEPGYSDPLQLAGNVWDEGSIFIEFTKENPRHFRYAIMAIKSLWNPDNLDWEEMEDRPMIQVDNPPFSRDRWTHIAFTYENMNTGAKNGLAKLYIDGEYVGSFGEREQTFGWDPENTALTVGLSYIGLIDDVAVFDRPLTPEEIKLIYNLDNGIASLAP